MAQKLIVPIIADSSAFKRGLKESSTAATQFESKIKSTTTNVRSHVLGLATAFVGVGGVIEAFDKSISAAEELNKATRSLNAQLATNHESFKAIEPQLTALESQMSKLGFTNAQTEQAFTRLDRASGSSAASLKYMTVTADLARAKHIELAQAALLIGKVMDGATSALNRYGIAIPKGVSATEALRIAQQKLAGQAEANVNPMDKFHAVLTNIEATIGEAVLPEINKLLDKLTPLMQHWLDSGQAAKQMKTATHDLGIVLHSLAGYAEGAKKAFDGFSDIVGGNRHAIELLTAAFVAFKLRGVASLTSGISVAVKKLAVLAGAEEAAGLGTVGGILGAVGGVGFIAAEALKGGNTGKIGNQTVTQHYGRYLPGTGGAYTPTDGTTASSRGQMRGAGASFPNNAARYSQSQIANMWIAAGGDPSVATTMAAIAMAESGGRSNATNYNTNGSTDRGIFQINSVHGYAPASSFNPMANVKQAVSVFNSQGLHAWSTFNNGAYRQFAGKSGGTGPLPGDATAADANAKKAAAAASKAAAAAYKSWKDNYFTPLDNQYKSDLLVTNEAQRLNKLEALHAKIAIDLKGATGKEHQDLLNEENKVQGKIIALRKKAAAEQKAVQARAHADYIKSLQADLASAQSALARQQTLFDRSWSRIVANLTASVSAKYSAKTPEEQARDDFQARLDAQQRASDLAGAQNDLAAAQLSGDPDAIRQAQAALDDVQNQQKLSDLQAAADTSRTIQDAQQQTALDNLNDWLGDQKTALEGGTQTWDGFWKAAFSDAPEKYAPDAVGSLQGVIDQMNTIATLQSQINGTGGSPSTSGMNGAAGFFTLNPLPHFKDGGVMPGAFGMPGLAVLHGGETIVPAGQAGGVVVHVTVNGDVTGEELVSKVVDGINRRARSGSGVLRASALIPT